MSTYESWRCTFQSSEQAAKAAWKELEAARAQQGEAPPVAKVTNEMKAQCIGEFSFTQESACTACHYDVPDEDCEVCNGEVHYDQKITVPWDTCKEIYKRMAKYAPHTPTAMGGVPDYVREALLRLIENGGQLEPASREDALVVAKHRNDLTAAPAPCEPTNRYGVDAPYFHGKLKLILRDLENYTPAELARSLGRLAVTADSETLREPEFNIGDLAGQPKYRDEAPTSEQSQTATTNTPRWCKKCLDEEQRNTFGGCS